MELGSRVVETWFKAVTLSRYDVTKQVVYITAPNSFVKEWIQRHYIEIFTINLKRLLHTDTLSIVFSEGSTEVEIDHIKENVEVFTPAVRDVSATKVIVSRKKKKTRLNKFKNSF